MNNSDTFAVNMFRQGGYDVTYRMPGRMELTKKKPHAMRVYIKIFVGIKETNKLMISVLNFTDSTDFQEIFDKYDQKIFEFEKASPVFESTLTNPIESAIMEPSIENTDGTLDSLFS